MEAYDTAVALRRTSTRLALRLRAERTGDGLGSTGVAVLGQLHRRGALTASEIAAAERVQPQSLTRVLASLEEQDLINREQDAQDRRRHTIELTEDHQSSPNDGGSQPKMITPRQRLEPSRIDTRSRGPLMRSSSGMVSTPRCSIGMAGLL